MNSIAFGIETLSQHEFLNCDEALLGVWLRLCRYCGQVENSGRIVRARDWKEGNWQRNCAIESKWIKKDCFFWKWDGEDLVLPDYPLWSQEIAQRNRRGAHMTNNKRWPNRANVAERDAQRVGDRVAERQPKSQSDSQSDSLSESHARTHVRTNVSEKKNSSSSHRARARAHEKKSASPPDLKIQWAATRAEIKRLELLEAEQDGQLSGPDAIELARLRRQLHSITVEQAGGGSRSAKKGGAPT